MKTIHETRRACDDPCGRSLGGLRIRGRSAQRHGRRRLVEAADSRGHSSLNEADFRSRSPHFTLIGRRLRNWSAAMFDNGAGDVYYCGLRAENGRPGRLARERDLKWGDLRKGVSARCRR